MSRTSISTPCPPPYEQSSLPIPAAASRRSSISSVGAGQDDTAEIEYTRVFDLGLKAAKPRRRSTFQQRKAQKEAPITIFEDVLEEQELVVEQPRREFGGATLMGRPAQKPIVRRRESVLVQDVQQQQGTGIAQVTVPERGPHQSNTSDGNDFHASTALKKEPRRRTIFVPPDDTTVFTIHPGANTTDRLNDTFQLPNNYVKATVAQPHRNLGEASVFGANKATKRPRLSMAVAPKRLPLQSVAGQDVYNVHGTDQAGQNGGKENVPPGNIAERAIHKREEDGIEPLKQRTTSSSLHQATAASKSRQSIVPREGAPLPRNTATTVARQQAAARRQSLRPDMAAHHTRPDRTRFSLHAAEIQPDRVQHVVTENKPDCQRRQSQRPLLRKVRRLSQYPVLSEDLAQPELYEDNWLSHQEIALTEVINQLFRNAGPNEFDWKASDNSLRDRVIKAYHQQEVTRLYKRLQASLLCGALSRPNGTRSPPNPAFDIGLRKRFLGMWLESYDHHMLLTAAEVVFGRQLPKRSSVNGTGSTLDPHTYRRNLIGFLETFLVEVEDAEEPEVDRGDDSHPRWRKMILRSLMLIWLLDQIKANSLASGCLFKTSSARKSSAAMLNTLSSMLIPSTGDIARTLKHLNYEVSHVQDPLDEVNYKIENIAVDLRDGILLTKLVEILLFSHKKLLGQDTSNDATLTIRMPDLTILESALSDVRSLRSPRVLSQHLKMPCLGRAQKIFNVDVALSALRDHARIGDDDVSSDDIVNGHRERTLSLLWSLVSAHGLECLVDFGELLTDIKRSGGEGLDLPEDCDALSAVQQESLLKKWASAHCAGKGIRVSNLTTAFADGKTYAAILESFADSTPVAPKGRTASPCDMQARLRAFGCSEAFIKQITVSAGTIPSRKSTVSNLAFLAARLLPLKRKTNAVTVIQRAFRRRRAKASISRRIVQMRLAHDCATVVQTQQRVTDAAVVLQRAWRTLLDARIARLNRQVEELQCLAKGWIVRRREQRRKFGKSRRVMGGW